MNIQETSTWKRLEDQIQWYDKKSRSNQSFYKIIKIAQFFVAAFIPIAAGLSWPAIITGSLGALIIISESIQQLYQFQYCWHSYRSTCEYLKHEKYLFLAKAALYSNSPNPEVLLAERIESLISQEHAKWVSTKTQEKSKTHDTSTQ